MIMKFFNAFLASMKRSDTIPMERLENSKVQSTIESYCEQYLHNSRDVLKFEALPNALDATVAVLGNASFLEKYEFSQVSETCFIVRLREIDLL